MKKLPEHSLTDSIFLCNKKNGLKKALLFCFLSFALMHQSIAQTTPLSQKQMLSQKSKHQRTAAWVLLGGGAAIAFTSMWVGASHVLNDILTGRKSWDGIGGTIAGFTIAAGSIPFFIMSGHNRKLSLNATGFQRFIPQGFEPLTYRRKMALQLKFTQTIF